MTTTKKSPMSINSREIPQDDLLPGLAALLDAQQVREILKLSFDGASGEINHCQVSYVRYKPATNCLIAYSAQFIDPGSGESRDILFHGKCYTDADFNNAAYKAASHQWMEVPGLKPVIPLPALCSIIYLFPNDCQLDGLRTIYDSRKITRLLYEYVPKYPKREWRISDKRLRITVVRYKPEKRAVLRLDTRAISRLTRQKEHLCLYMRSYCDNRGELVFTCMKSLYEAFHAKPGLTVPQPLAYLPEKRLLLMDGLDGDQLVDHLAGSDKLDCVTRAAQALAVLHRFNGVDAPKRVAADLMLDARSTGNLLTRIVPDSCHEIEQILATADTLESFDDKKAIGFVHGDFHCGQVLIQDGGEAILDFDRSYLGDPLADVGNFCAHLRLLGLQKRLSDITRLSDAFIEAYAGASDKKLNHDKLTLWTALGLFQFSVRPFRTLEANWKARTVDILKECRNILP